MLVIVSGCSGVGKNTIINELLKRDENVVFLKTCTTRKKRYQEHGSEEKSPYIFISKEEFDKKIENEEFIEYEEIHKNFYGMLKKSVDEIITSDKVFIKDLGVLGQINLSRYLKGKAEVVSIFLQAPKKVLIERLKNRGESDIDLRLSRMEFEMSYISNYDYVINNINLERTLKKIQSIIKKHQKKSEKVTSKNKK